MEQASWDTIAIRLAPDRSYWLSTVGPMGEPHVAPVWGVVIDGAWYCYSERTSRKARNLAVDARVALHLADGEDVLIVHGELRDIGMPTSQPAVLAGFASKYGREADLPYLPTADPAFDVLYRLAPTAALSWRLDAYDASQQRWRRTQDGRPSENTSLQ